MLDTARTLLFAIAGLLVQGCATPPKSEAPLVPIRVAGARWIELSPVLVAANSFYPVQMTTAAGGVPSITSGEADLATNAETQLLRESVKNPDLRIIMTVTESFYRLVARRSAGISKVADLKGKRIMLPRMTSAHYYLVAMLRTAGLNEEDVTLVNLPRRQGRSDGHGPDVRCAGPWRSGCHLHLGAGARGGRCINWARMPSCCRIASVYREVFNLHARAPDLADPEKRRAIVAFVRAVSHRPPTH